MEAYFHMNASTGRNTHTYARFTVYANSSLHTLYTHTRTPPFIHTYPLTHSLHLANTRAHAHILLPRHTPSIPTPSLILSSLKRRRKPSNYKRLLSRRAQRCIYQELIWLSGAKHSAPWRGRQAEEEEEGGMRGRCTLSLRLTLKRTSLYILS